MTPEERYGNDHLAIAVIKEKYLQPGEDIDDMFERVAAAVAERAPKYKEDFFRILSKQRFVPGGRILAGAGVQSFRNSLTNCYCGEIDDHIWNGFNNSSIYKCLIDHALTYKYGGGTSANLSHLRPKGASIESSGGESCGPVGFMNLFSVNTGTISSGRNRRGALLLALRVDHPDVSAFIHSKEDLPFEEILHMIPSYEDRRKAFKMLQQYRSIQYANISLLCTDEFMHAVERDEDFVLRWAPGSEYVYHGKGVSYKTVKARALFDEIVEAAWRSAEPGVLFYDTIVRNFTTQAYKPFECTNPCGEQPLSPHANCNLGSLNLSKYVESDTRKFPDRINWHRLKDDIYTVIRFMDCVIDVNINNHILPQQKTEAYLLRRIGLGFMGLADMFIELGIRYGSRESIVLAEKLAAFIKEYSWLASCDLAEELGPAPLFKEGLLSLDDFMKTETIAKLPTYIKEMMIKVGGPRNTAVNTVAPTGTTSIIAQTSSGIEPIFSKKITTRRVRNAQDSQKFDEYLAGHKLLLDKWPNQNYPYYVVDAHDISPFERIELQAAVQKHFDSNISSTINLPQDTSKETVRKIFLLAWRLGLRGVTIYREGSRDSIISLS